jgi:hypothetical protein
LAEIEFNPWILENSGARFSIPRIRNLCSNNLGQLLLL